MHTNNNFIPVVVDLPVSTPKLGFEKYVDALAAAVMGGDPARYTVGLYGPWGTGKSSILQGLENKLSKYSEPPLVIKFDAWRHERVDNVMLPLLWTIQNAVKSVSKTEGAKILSKEGATRAGKALGRLMNGMELAAFGVALKLPSGEREDGENPQDAANRYMESLSQLEVLGESISGRIVVLIDDLDRCTPTRVVEIIETIRLLMDVEGFVFVLAIDYAVLVEAIKKRYKHTDPEKFIEKIVQVPFWIPSLQIEDKNLLTSLIPKWNDLKDEWFKNVEPSSLQQIFKLALRGNPRQIKRLLNSYLVARHVVGDDGNANNTLLAASIAMQLRWPTQFQQFERRLSMLAGVQGSSLIVKDTDDFKILSITEIDSEQRNLDLFENRRDAEISQDRYELGTFVSTFFGGETEIQHLIDSMRIAANVTQGSMTSDLDARVRRNEQDGRAFEASLIERTSHALNRINAAYDNQSSTWFDEHGDSLLRIDKISHKLAQARIEFSSKYQHAACEYFEDEAIFVNRSSIDGFINTLEKVHFK